MLPRILGAISLRPNWNSQDSYYFLNLNSGKHIIRNNWTVLSMPNEIINTKHQFAAICNKYKGLVFTNKDGNIITDENDDIEDNIEITGVDNEDDKYYIPPEETKEIVSPLEEIYSPLEENFSQPETT